MNCGYSLEPPRRGGSNEYPQSMFWAEIWKIWKFSILGGEIFNIFELACFRNELLFVTYCLRFCTQSPSENDLFSPKGANSFLLE